MKKQLLCLGLTSLFLLGCSKKNEDIDFISLKSKIENKEDFIFAITMENCAHCLSLKKTYNRSKYQNVFYEISLDKIDEGIQNNDLNMIDEYKYLIGLTLHCYNNIKSSTINDTYFNFISLTYEEMYGKDSYLAGYENLVTPLSFFIIDGQVYDFVIGDYSSSLDLVMENYLKEVK